jgi:hypothetical protein
MVWICEYPYRTVRLDGPCDDCLCEELSSETQLAHRSVNAEAGSAKEETIGNGVPIQRDRAGFSTEVRNARVEPRVLPFRDNR